MNTVEILLRSNAVDVIVIDSVAALAPLRELEGEIGDAHIGLQARLMSQSLRKLTSIIGKSQTAVIFTNQIREKIGIMFGNPETTPGGRALKFYASVRIEVKKIGLIKEGEQAIGTRIKAQIVKNKIAPPFREVRFAVLFDYGVDDIRSNLDWLKEQKVESKLEVKGAWYSWGEAKLGCGEEAAIRAVEKMGLERDVEAEVARVWREVYQPPERKVKER